MAFHSVKLITRSKLLKYRSSVEYFFVQDTVVLAPISTRGTYVGVQEQNRLLSTYLAHKTLNKFSSTKKTCAKVKKYANNYLTEGLGIITK